MLRRILIAIVVLIGAVFLWNEWEIWRFTHPTDRDAAEEIEMFTGYVLPDSSPILAGARTRPSPLLGDYSSAIAVQFDEAGFADFKERLPPNDVPNFDGGIGPVEKLGSLGGAQFESYRFLELPPRGDSNLSDQLYLISIDDTRRIALFGMSWH